MSPGNSKGGLGRTDVLLEPNFGGVLEAGVVVALSKAGVARSCGGLRKSRTSCSGLRIVELLNQASV